GPGDSVCKCPNGKEVPMNDGKLAGSCEAAQTADTPAPESQPVVAKKYYPKQDMLDTAIRQCREETSSIRPICTPEESSGLASALSGLRTLSQGAAMYGTAMACGKLGQYLRAAQGAIGGFETSCVTKINSCRNACST